MPQPLAPGTRFPISGGFESARAHTFYATLEQLRDFLDAQATPPTTAPSGDVIIGEVPSGIKNDSNKVFTVAGVVLVAVPVPVGFYFNGTRLTNVPSNPNSTQYTLSGATFTLGLAPSPLDSLLVDYLQAASATTVIGAIPTGTKNGVNKNFTLPDTPSSVDSVGLYFNGPRLARVASGPNAMQYTLSGANIVLGLAPESTDSLLADYLK